MFISEFTMDIRHVPGKSNVMADTLSCPSTTLQTTPPVMTAKHANNDAEPNLANLPLPPHSLSPIDWADFAVRQVLCQDVQ